MPEVSATSATSSISAGERSGRDLQEDRDWPGEAGARFHHAGKQGGKRRTPLKVAQLFSIGRADIDGGKVDIRAADRQHPGEIGRAVRAVLVGARVQAHRHRAGFPGGKAGGDGLGAVIVEAEAVDHRAILGQAKQARLGVAGLRARRGGAQFQKAETGAHQGGHRHRVLVEPGRKTHRIGQRHRPRGSLPRRGEVITPGNRPDRRSGLEGEAMGRLGVHAVHQRHAGAFDQLHITPSGKMWPAAPSGRLLSQTHIRQFQPTMRWGNSAPPREDFPCQFRAQILGLAGHAPDRFRSKTIWRQFRQPELRWRNG